MLSRWLGPSKARRASTKVANVQGTYERGELGEFRVPGYQVVQRGREAVVLGPDGGRASLRLDAYDHGVVVEGGEECGSFEVQHVGVKSLPLTLRFHNGVVLVRVNNCFVSV